jgi:type III pantothenate kinase
MDLLFDLGHSRLKWAGWAHGQLHAPASAEWRGQAPEQFCQRILANLDRPQRVGIAAVARGEPLLALQDALRTRWDCSVSAPLAAARCGPVRNGYRDPAQLGFDRWAALVGAHARQPGNAALVVDCGSAVTVDGLRGDGQHLGGIIFPGPVMMAEAFYGRTGLPPAAVGSASAIAARTTADAVAAGVWQAIWGGVERAIRAWQAHLPQATVWLTGGDAATVARGMTLPIPVQHAPHLVLEGLGQILEREDE